MVRFNLLRFAPFKPRKKSPPKKILFMAALLFISVFVFISAAITFNGFPLFKAEAPPAQVLDTEEPVIEETVPRSLTIENLVRRGDTIVNVLNREGVDYQTAHKFFTDVKPVYNLRRIIAGQKYSLVLSASGTEIESFTYEIDANRYLEVRPAIENGVANGGFSARIVVVPYIVNREVIKGSINNSLFQSILLCGEKPELADILASLYEYDVDFNRDIRPGDSWAVIVEKKYLDGKFVTYGNVLASEFINRGKITRVIRYTDPEGRTAYYHPDGRSVRKMFLRCPLPFMRVTSSYGNRRHPVLGFSARHNGVDFAAPVGTKIRASASGVVQSVGYDRGRGRYILIRHPNRYISNYYHLSRIAAGIRSGVRVEQGQLIGYVGTTGLSTGPHLHYGLMKDGRFINPLLLKSPTKNPVKKEYMETFRRYMAGYFLVISGSRLMKLPKGIQDFLLASPSSTVPVSSGSPMPSSSPGFSLDR